MHPTDPATNAPTARLLARRPRTSPLAWAVAAAQAPFAAWAWFSCFALGLVGRRPAARPEEARAARTLHSARPAPVQPTRRRTDAFGQPAKPTVPLLTAHHDALTDLSALRALGEADTAWSDDLEQRGLRLCVLHVGLDRVAPIVERYGTDAGEQVLRQVARRLRQLVRDEDRVLRVEEHEFVLLLAAPHTECLAFTRSMSARIKSELQRPLSYRTLSTLQVGCSVGLAIWPMHGDSLDAVLRHAADMLASIRPRQAEPVAAA
ncbi:MAG TPA: GGDEF domain-containing protein [Rhizobacter sp.]